MADGFTSAEGATRMTTERVTPGVWIALGSAAVQAASGPASPFEFIATKLTANRAMPLPKCFP